MTAIDGRTDQPTNRHRVTHSLLKRSLHHRGHLFPILYPIFFMFVKVTFYCSHCFLHQQDMLPNADTAEYGDPSFALFCQITFSQTMILFFESIFVLVLWHGDSPYSIFYQVKEQKAADSSSSSSSSYSSSSSHPLSSSSSLGSITFLGRTNSYSLEKSEK